jgi:hypothetical protein
MVRRLRIFGGVFAAVLSALACAESEDLNNCPGTGGTSPAPAAAGATAAPNPCGPQGSGGAGATGGGSCTHAPDCGGCQSCFDVCVCWGTDPNQCLAQCGTGGSSGAGAAGGAGGAGAVGGSGGGFGGSGGGFGGSGGGFGGSGGGFGGSGGGFGGSGGGFGGSSGAGSCCTPSLSPGCSNASIANCVCAQDSYCCSIEWDSQCVDEVDTFGCGSCFGGSGGSGGSSGCSVQLQEPICSACMQSACCSPAEACVNDPGCGNLGTCIGTNCPTATTLAAISSCIDTTCSQYAASKTVMMTYLTCLSTNCSTECGI